MTFRFGPFHAHIQADAPVLARCADTLFVRGSDTDAPHILSLKVVAAVPPARGPEARLAADAIRLSFAGWDARVGPGRAALRMTPAALEARDVLCAALESVGLAWTLLARGLMLHCSAVQGPGGALVFAGRSGIGKSTTARLVAAKQCLAEDQALLLPGPQGWQVQGATRPRGPAAPLHRLFLLARGARTTKTLLSSQDALPAILANVILWQADRRLHERVLDTARRLAADAPVYRLEVCLADLSLSRLLD